MQTLSYCLMTSTTCNGEDWQLLREGSVSPSVLGEENIIQDLHPQVSFGRHLIYLKAPQKSLNQSHLKMSGLLDKGRSKEASAPAYRKSSLQGNSTEGNEYTGHPKPNENKLYDQSVRMPPRSCAQIVISFVWTQLSSGPEDKVLKNSFGARNQEWEWYPYWCKKGPMSSNLLLSELMTWKIRQTSCHVTQRLVQRALECR